MELSVLEVQATQEEISLNGATEVEIETALDKLDQVIFDIDMEIENSIQKVGKSYVTSKANAAFYKEMYGWIFSEIAIAELS